MPHDTLRAVKRWILLGVAGLLVSGLLYVWIVGAGIIAGYSAKMLCSCVLVAERTEEQCLAQDLAAYAPYISARADRSERWAEAFALGLRTARAEPVATLAEGGGCTLR